MEVEFDENDAEYRPPALAIATENTYNATVLVQAFNLKPPEPRPPLHQVPDSENELARIPEEYEQQSSLQNPNLLKPNENISSLPVPSADTMGKSLPNSTETVQVVEANNRNTNSLPGHQQTLEEAMNSYIAHEDGLIEE